MQSELPDRRTTEKKIQSQERRNSMMDPIVLMLILVCWVMVTHRKFSSRARARDWWCRNCSVTIWSQASHFPSSVFCPTDQYPDHLTRKALGGLDNNTDLFFGTAFLMRRLLKMMAAGCSYPYNKHRTICAKSPFISESSWSPRSLTPMYHQVQSHHILFLLLFLLLL